MKFSRPIANLNVFNFHWKSVSVRYSVAVGIALINALFKAEGSLFQGTFHFPLSIFFYSLLFVFTVCSSSWVVTSLLKESLFKDGYINLKNTVRFILANVVVALTVYTFLYLIVNGQIFIKHYTFYFLLTIAVVSIENLIYLLYCTIENTNNLRKELQLSDKTTFLVPSGQKQVPVSFEDISCASLKNGIVSLHTVNGPIVTHFTSLEEMEQKLPSNQFYRANRQFILHKKAIKEIRKDVNRKLRVVVNGPLPEKEISVSRYKNKDLINWMQAN